MRYIMRHCRLQDQFRRSFALAALLLAVSLLLGGCAAPAAMAAASVPAASPAADQAVWGATVTEAVATPDVKEANTAAGSAAEIDPLRGNDMPITEGMLSAAAIEEAMTAYNIQQGSSAAAALVKINGTYSETLSEAQQSGLLVFLFEGAGENQDPEERKDAMCVVVKDGQILYLSLCCSTIPDYPFSPWKNDGDDVPTLVSGVYSFDTVNHNGKYAALRVLDDHVIRFHDTDEFYPDVSNNQSIQVHRRGREENSPDDEQWANSIGCLLVGHAGTDPTDDYARFAHAVGILKESAGGSTPYQMQAYGTLIVDRSLGADYLRAVGYTDAAIEAIGA